MSGESEGVDKAALQAARSASGRKLAPRDIASDTSGPEDNVTLKRGRSSGGLRKSASGEIRPWDIAKRGRKVGAQKLTMPFIIVFKAVCSLLGFALCLCTYGLLKVGEAAGLGKAVEWQAFMLSFDLWFRLTGFFYSVRYVPLGATGKKLAELYGLEKEPRATDMKITPLLVANHTSYLDGALLGTAFSGTRIIAKASVRDAPILGRFMQELGYVFVERGKRDSRQQAMDAVDNHCTQWKQGDRPLLFFPEGTTTNGEGLIDFKRGAFVSGLPVRPVVMVYPGWVDVSATTYKMTPKGVKELSGAEWMYQTLGCLFHVVRVYVLPPYIPSEAERNDPEEYAKNVREVMLKELVKRRAENGMDSGENGEAKKTSRRTKQS